ncbi:hypothetical protein CNMCM6936_003195 [Aspergillus lentulus]|nr:hypothetical protein CNMCM6069_009569 [Aspergillus lentulus]KAF4161676.1 hypothetical protein CNMCM6936_003195 [Aspergillus lentulus]
MSPESFSFPFFLDLGDLLEFPDPNTRSSSKDDDNDEILKKEIPLRFLVRRFFRFSELAVKEDLKFADLSAGSAIPIYDDCENDDCRDLLFRGDRLRL